MTFQAVTLNLPETVYQQVHRAAERVGRSLNEVLVEIVVAAAPATVDGMATTRAALAQMAYLSDAALWQAARATMTPEQRDRLATLHDKQQREGLTAEEQSEEQALLALYRETILVRAQAAVLLKRRGYDVSDSTQFAPFL